MLDIHSLLDSKCYCPCYCCTQQDCSSCQEHSHTNTKDILEKLVVVLNDKEARNLVTRHILLLNHYIGVTNKIIKIPDMPYFCLVLEHLCKGVSEDESYFPSLLVLIEMMQVPIVPSVVKEKDLKVTLSDYLTTIGNCLKSVPGNRMKSMLISAFTNVFRKSVPGYSIRYQVVWSDALTDSCLPILISDLILNLDGMIYFELLQAVMIILDFTIESAEDFLVSKCVENILLKWHEIDVLTGKLKFHFLKIMSNIILTLLTCVPEEQIRNVPPPRLEALINLRDWLRWEITQHDSARRNDVLAIISRLVYLYSNLELVRSEIMKDFFLLTFSPKPEIDNSWANGWIFDSDNIDPDRIIVKTVIPAEFETRILLLNTSKLLMDLLPAKVMAKELNICSTLPRLLNISKTVKEKKLLFWQEIKLALEVISRMSAILPNELIKYKIPKRLMSLLKYLHRCWEHHDTVLHQSLLCLETFLNHEIFLMVFQELDCIRHLLDMLSTFTTKCTSWTMTVQKNLLLTIHILSIFARNSETIVGFKKISTNILMSVLKRLYKPSEGDIKMEPRLILCTLDLVWKTEVLLRSNRSNFIKLDGVSLCINILEVSIYPVQIIALGLLVDLLESVHSVPYAVVWKSSRTGLTFLPLLCNLWRICENKKSVSRNSLGSIEDLQKPIVEKKCTTEFPNRNDCTPAILEMSLCLRPKIYCIVSLLLGIHKDLIEKFEESTHITFNVLSKTDQITLHLIEHYELMKEGDIWRDIKRKLVASGSVPLPCEDQLLHIIELKQLYWAKSVAMQQKYIEREILRKDVEEEQELYAKYRDLTNPTTFKIYKTLKHRALIEDPKLRAQMKKKLVEKIMNTCKYNATIIKNPTKANVTTETVGRRVKYSPSDYFSNDKKQKVKKDEYISKLRPTASFLVPNYSKMDHGSNKMQRDNKEASQKTE